MVTKTDRKAERVRRHKIIKFLEQQIVQDYVYTEAIQTFMFKL